MLGSAQSGRESVRQAFIGWLWVVAAAVLCLLPARPALAASCNAAASQGTGGPSNYQTYCWLDFTTYNDTTAHSAGGQAFSFTLPDGGTLAFTLKVSGSTLAGSTSPSWGGAAIGNSGFLTIGGKPLLYQVTTNSVTLTLSSITMTPAAGGASSNWALIAADGESSNDGESLTFQTNGGAWALATQVSPTSGSIYPSTTGAGTQIYTITGTTGTVGANVVTTTAPTTLVASMNSSGGLQGIMLAVRLASIRLSTQVIGARADSADQFKADIKTTTGGTTVATVTSSGTGLGTFAGTTFSTGAPVALTLAESMATGSTYALSHYATALTCTNATSGSGTSMPTAVATASYSLGTLAPGDVVTCTYAATPYLTKALAASGRQFSGDQFTVTIATGGSTVATTTTAATAATVTNGTTSQVQVNVGSAYAFSESASGTTMLGQYTATMACTNAYSGSSTTLPSATGGSVTPQMGDVIACTITNTKRALNATLSLAKSSAPVSDPVNGATNPKIVPGAVLRYMIQISNSGPSAVDSNTVFIVDALPAQLQVGTASSPTFAQGSPTSNLSFTPATDIRYSNAASAPTSFAACTYSPSSAYDPAVKFVCLNPKGSMAGSSGTPPSFTISFQAQVK